MAIGVARRRYCVSNQTHDTLLLNALVRSGIHPQVRALSLSLRFALAPFRSLAVSLSRRFALSPFRSLAVSLSRRFALSLFRSLCFALASSENPLRETA